MTKYKNTKEWTNSVDYLRFEEQKEKELLVSDWDFTKHSSGYLFKCYVLQEDGVEVDKIWTVWDYESMMRLKKKLGTKPGEQKTLKVKMVLVDDEQTFEIL